MCAQLNFICKDSNNSIVCFECISLPPKNRDWLLFTVVTALADRGTRSAYSGSLCMCLRPL